MQRTFLLLLTCTGLLLAAAAGCGSNQGCEDYASTLCNRQIACSAQLAAYDGSAPATCQSIYAQTCQLSTQSPDSNWTQAAAEACSQALMNVTCDEILGGPFPSACQPAGNRAIGAACGDAFQCQSLYCNIAMAGQCGVCAAQSQSGGPCATANDCTSGLQCSQNLCAPYRNQGEACDANFGCEPTLACSNGMCQAAMLGQTCSGSYDYCDINALQVCDSSTVTCQALNYTVAAIGAACGSDGSTGTYTDCVPNAYCKGLGTQSFGVCTALPATGQACAIEPTTSGSVYQLCLPPSTCITGTCQTFNGSSCH
jgi:hypothetical protein